MGCGEKNSVACEEKTKAQRLITAILCFISKRHCFSLNYTIPFSSGRLVVVLSSWCRFAILVS